MLKKRLRGGHAYIRHGLYMHAMVALKHDPLVSVFGQRLKSQGLAPQAVISACMKKMVRLICGVLKSAVAFNPNLLGNRIDCQDGIWPQSHSES